ncbi:MAG: SH3 domain-containing protein [Defluviitaleaceae bacterium]|nr:SH3 domain-containing protein [Defluviitaleaceae bacterium]MCL2273997.1 SH3 domain-containing protein [Defluviitaleaceae bacterium]MCL2274102.1 SH3 domain-containing protein [Defluviitaleaceae bacterium]
MNLNRPGRKENNALLKKVNRVSTGRRKAGVDGVKIAIIMVLLMVAIAILLIFIGNLELPQIGGDTTPAYENGDPVAPSIIGDPFEEVDGEGFVLPPMAEDMVFYHYEGGLTELPVIGATGWVAATSPLRDAPAGGGSQIVSLPPGSVFTILDAQAEWWYVRLPNETTGWVDHRRCFINLPDVLPSVIFDIINARDAEFRSSGFDLPNITGEVLYSAYGFNYRLGRYEYIVPGMYTMARALHNVQQLALSNNETLIVYEVFRPHSTQQAVVTAMNQLMNAQPLVGNAIRDSAWTLTWFISTGVSNHQRGGAVDATLARIRDSEIHQTGDYAFIHITQFDRINAGTRIHELSPSAAIVNTPRGISAQQVLGGNVEMTGAAMTGGIVRMQWYFANAGFNPLASEWWHFDHRPSIDMANNAGITGNFYTEEIHSEPPARG